MTARKLTAAVLGGMLLAFAFAAAGGARVEKVARLRLHDEFLVKGSHIVCAVGRSKVLIAGQELITCGFLNSKGPVPTSYAVALAANGHVVLARVRANGTPAIVMRRPSVVSQAAARYYTLTTGDEAVVAGTALRCSIGQESVGATSDSVVTCFEFDRAARKPRANSYGTGITDLGAFIVHFNSKSKPVPIKVVEHGR